jgi:hypothetical protein
VAIAWDHAGSPVACRRPKTRAVAQTQSAYDLRDACSAFGVCSASAMILGPMLFVVSANANKQGRETISIKWSAYSKRVRRDHPDNTTAHTDEHTRPHQIQQQ